MEWGIRPREFWNWDEVERAWAVAVWQQYQEQMTQQMP